MRLLSSVSVATFVVLVSSPLLVSAQQQSPLTSLFGTIQKIAAAGQGTATPAAQVAGKQQEASPNDASTDDIIQSLANERVGVYVPGCDELRKIALDRISVAERTADYSAAASNARVGAVNEAACAVAKNGTASAQQKAVIGTLLAIASLNYAKANMIIDSTVRDAYNAKLLLKLNERANQQWITQLDEAYWPKGPIADANAFETLSALEAAAKYQKNAFGFERAYAGKTLKIKGRVLNVTGSDARASILIEGIKRDADQRGWQDSIRCDVKDKAALDATAQISKGDMVSIQGIYKKGLLPGVALEDCRLVR